MQDVPKIPAPFQPIKNKKACIISHTGLLPKVYSHSNTSHILYTPVRCNRSEIKLCSNNFNNSNQPMR